MAFFTILRPLFYKLHMKSIVSKGWLAIILVLGLLVTDQVIKIVVKTTMFYDESIRITDWFYIHFIENPGMAFGMQIIPKTIQTVARMVFAGFIIWYMAKLVKANFRSGYIVCISMILAGALGNILDSIFYGVMFSQSTFSQVATFVPIGEGYTGWLHGKVVDMFHFPLFEFDWPQWIPFVGGDHFLFFSPVFNFADACISCGMIILLLFFTKDFNESIQVVKGNGKK